MDKARAVEHFLYYLAHHPALGGLNCPTVLLGHTERYDAIAQAITQSSAARFNFQVQRLDLAASDRLVALAHGHGFTDVRRAAGPSAAQLVAAAGQGLGIR